MFVFFVVFNLLHRLLFYRIKVALQKGKKEETELKNLIKMRGLKNESIIY